MSIAVDRVIHALELHGCNPRKSGDGYESRCPAHEDNKPSLSIGAGGEGRCLVRCHAGCDWREIVAAMGLEETDLFVSSNGIAPRELQTTDPAGDIKSLTFLWDRLIGKPTEGVDLLDRIDRLEEMLGLPTDSAQRSG